jgi:hypothetical protein
VSNIISHPHKYHNSIVVCTVSLYFWIASWMTKDPALTAISS